MASDETLWHFDLCAGRLALDFANTVSGRLTPTPIERLTSYDRIVGFAEQAGLATPAQARRLRAWARTSASDAERARSSIIVLRDAVYAVFLAVAEQRRPSERDLAVLTEWLHRQELDSSFEWQWAAGADAPDAFMSRILLSVQELITPAARDRIHLCGADDCAWLFFDTSKNRTRRWCDMKQCGNRAKARRFYKRQEAAGS